MPLKMSKKCFQIKALKNITEFITVDLEQMKSTSVSSKDPVDAATKSKANNELLGDDAREIWSNLMAATERSEEFTGWMRTDLYYSPKQ